MLAAQSRSMPRRLVHARLRNLGACASLSGMSDRKRVALSLRVSEHARDALHRKAEREGHRYPLTLAATLLERAVSESSSPAAPAQEAVDPLTMLRHVAAAIGGRVKVDDSGVLFTTARGSSTGATEWLRAQFARCPALQSLNLTVLPGLE